MLDRGQCTPALKKRSMATEKEAMMEKIACLANLAYERELQRELSRVQRHIDLYRERESRFFNLNEIKTKFYRETSDEIWCLYNQLEPEKAVERAVALGLLTEEEVPDDVRNSLQQAV
jgi:hypothetical protein